MSNPDFDVLVVGEINPDLIVSGVSTPEFGQVEQKVDNAVLTVGSSSVIFASGAAKLGLKVRFLGVCGNDIFGRFMLEAMQDRGIDIGAVRVDAVSHTGISVILNRPHDRAILTYSGCMDSLRAEQVTDSILSTTRHLHVSSYFLQTGLQPGLPDLFRKACNQGISTSLDTNWDPLLEWQGVREVLPWTTIFFPNSAEVCAISGCPDPKEAALYLGKQAGIIAVKLGESGGLAVCGESIAKVPAIPVIPVDTVGAGDSFDAGFIYGFLQGWELDRCLQLGIVCGSLSTRAAGGTDGQPSIDEALSSLSFFN